MRNVGSLLRLIEEQLPPTDDEQERHRRSLIRSEAATHLLIGALIVVKEYMPAHYRALGAAAMRFGEAKLAGRQSRFHVRRVPAVGGFDRTLLLMGLAALHTELSARLRANWNQKVSLSDSTKSYQIVSPTGRYGERQYEGHRRRLAMDRHRAGVLRNAVANLTGGEFDDAQALRLVRKKNNRSPAQLSLAAMAFMTMQEKRTVKVQVTLGRKRFAESAKLAAILEQRGYVSAAM
jgi:hypothetical protein